MGTTAFVLCEEVLGEGRLVATNIFVREDDDWRLVHHKAGPMAHSAHDEAGDDFQITLGANSGIAGPELLSALRLDRLTELGDDEADELEAMSLDEDDDEDPFELTGEDALAGGTSTSVTRSGPILEDPSHGHHSDLTDLADLGDLDDTEAPERFLNLTSPATRRLLN